MPRFRDFGIDFGIEESRQLPLTRKTAAFREAIRWSLAPAQIVAPFAKLSLRLVGYPAATSCFLFDNIAHCTIQADLARLEGSSQGEARDFVTEQTLNAFDWLEETRGWRDPKATEIVSNVGKHRGPYRFEWPRLLVRQRVGFEYHAVYEVDFDSEQVLVLRQDPLGSVTGSAVLWSSDSPGWLGFDFDPRKAKLVEGNLTYLDRRGTLIATVPLDAFGT